MRLFKIKPLQTPAKMYSFSKVLPDGRKMVFDAMWATFDPEKDYSIWSTLLPRYCDKDVIRILGPFWQKHHRASLEQSCAEKGKWDFFITGENRDNPLDLAEKCIGFRVPRTRREIRFPYWQWHTAWPGFETEPAYDRFGSRLSLAGLMQPIEQTHGSFSISDFKRTKTKAVLLTSHLRDHRRRLYKQTKRAMGCDAFGRRIRPTELAKKDLLESYPFSLCPENQADTGYITEKIPEAFLSGCIPIGYCQPEDLQRDFNPKAVINLYGLTELQCRQTLRNAGKDYDQFQRLRSEPLLLKEPSLDPLISFLDRKVCAATSSM